MSRVMPARRRLPRGQMLFTMALTVASLSMPATVHAGAPSLQVAPLQYEQALPAGQISSGYIDVANPADSPVNIVASVKGFRQTNAAGDLAFYDDADLAAAIAVGLPEFTLGPREAIRVSFSVDATKLPQGGTYAAIFFKTIPPTAAGSSSYVAQSANVGTLLMLTNGEATKHHGKIKPMQSLGVQVGSGVSGKFTFTNTDTTNAPVGFRPKLGVRMVPWGRTAATATGFVLPGVSREFSFNRPGSYVGLLPVTVTDADSGAQATQWILAVTGWYRLAVPFLVLMSGVGWWLWRRQKH